MDLSAGNLSCYGTGSTLQLKQWVKVSIEIGNLLLYLFLKNIFGYDVSIFLYLNLKEKT